MQKNLKIFSHSLRMSMLSIFVFSAFTCANAEVPSYHFQCSQTCQEKLQNALEKFRQTNQVTGMTLSISLPDENGSLQPIQTFYSGTVVEGGQVPVGALNKAGYPINLMGIASITKSFTAAIVLQLVAEGKLQLSDTVGSYLPQYSDWANVRIEQLLNMTSGIYDYEDGAKPFFNKLVSDPYYQWSPEEVMQISYQNTQKTASCPAGGNTCFVPGTSWYYSNADYMLLGMIIQKITGNSYEDELYSRLLGATSKLHQLNDTYYASYPYTEEVSTRLVHQYDDQFPPDERDTTFFNLSWDGPSGAMISNTPDLIRWARLLFQTQEVLPAPQLHQLTQLVCSDTNSSEFGKPIIEPDKNCSIGFGLGVMRVYSENTGLMWLYTGEGLGVNAVYILYDNYNIVIAMQYDKDADDALLLDDINQALGIPPIFSGNDKKINFKLSQR